MHDEGESRPARRRVVLGAVGIVLLAQFGFAFVAAPHACDWGLQAYTAVGGAVGLALLVFPWIHAGARIVPWRPVASLLLGVVGFGAWFGGLMAADFQLLCRLF